MGCQAIRNTRLQLKSKGEFIFCATECRAILGTDAYARAGLVRWTKGVVTFFWAPKESDKVKGSVKQRKHQNKWVIFDILVVERWSVSKFPKSH